MLCDTGVVEQVASTPDREPYHQNRSLRGDQALDVTAQIVRRYEWGERTSGH